jgi:hypothetical protein
LVVVVIGDEILDRVLGKETAKFLKELGGERLVVRKHERRTLRVLDDARDRERLAAAGDSQQHLVFGAVVEPFDKCIDRRRLITLRLVFRMKFETHGNINSNSRHKKAQNRFLLCALCAFLRLDGFDGFGGGGT